MLNIETFENANTVIGVILALFGIFSALIVWLDRRQKANAKSVVTETTGKSAALSIKVDDIENDVGAVRRDLSALSHRVQGVERSLETVARQSDLAKLQTEVAHLNGSVNASLKQLSGMMHSFHVSALRAAERKDKP